MWEVVPSFPGIAEQLDLLITVFPQDVQSLPETGANPQEKERRDGDKHVLNDII